jgi:hypothetical protein
MMVFWCGHQGRRNYESERRNIVNRIIAPEDRDIAWCIQLYQSHPEVCLQHLRTHYPESRVVLLMDGDQENLDRYARLSETYKAELVQGEHLMAFHSSHLYVERMLQQALSGNERFYFRIDPDTKVWRRFRQLPSLSCAFGTLETVTVALKDRIRHPPNIQGGCFGLTRDVVEGVLASGVLSHQRCVAEARLGWVRCADCEHVAARGMMLDDFVLSWAVDAADFPIIQHPEIASYWRHPVVNEALNFAVTHPHKEMDV